MVTIAELWLPILLSGVFVFVASSIFHMVIPIHKGDYKKLSNEEAVLNAMRSQGVAPGSYMFPFPDSMKEMGSPEMLEKWKRGPVGFMTILPSGTPNMGKNLIQWFIYTLIVSAFVAYAASLSLAPGAAYMPVFRLTGTIAILVYAVGSMPESIWKGQRWGVTAKFIFDGSVYGLVTAGTFGWMWPGTVA